jgi:hypothetical protein
LLTTGAFAALAGEPSIGRAEAFRRAMMAMLDPSKPGEFAHPQVWAPFALVGEGNLLAGSLLRPAGGDNRFERVHRAQRDAIEEPRRMDDLLDMRP